MGPSRREVRAQDAGADGAGDPRPGSRAHRRQDSLPPGRGRSRRGRERHRRGLGPRDPLRLGAVGGRSGPDPAARAAREGFRAFHSAARTRLRPGSRGGRPHRPRAPGRSPPRGAAGRRKCYLCDFRRLMDQILIVDDDRSIRELLSMHLEERGFGVVSAATGAEGFRLAEENPPAAIVLDMRLPDVSGIDLIPELRKRAAEAPVLMITAHHDMASTILAMKAGAFDYIHKPIDIQAFDVALDRALEVRRLSRGTDYLSVEGSRPFKMDDIIGTSPAMQQLFKDVGRVASSKTTVLIQGESGTGKELIARVVHSYSAPQKPFIAINCSAIVDTLLESELFGHEKGAFTGAVQAKPGKFELAEDGSIFLDEIGDLSLNLQAK